MLEKLFLTLPSQAIEILTDPSYDGQIITFTYPHIGNTGINFEDNESKQVSARGMIVKNFCDFPSNWRSKQSLEEFLIEQKVICISDIDTRQLTKILRDEGCKVERFIQLRVLQMTKHNLKYKILEVLRIKILLRMSQ